ncbi:MAG: glycoside hydrolase family 9 protein [Bacteroidota bacterium]
MNVPTRCVSIAFCCLLPLFVIGQQNFHLRFNQAGYLAGEEKSMLLLTNEPIRERLELWDHSSNQRLQKMKLKPMQVESWGESAYHYSLDASKIQTLGTYYWRAPKTGWESPHFEVQASPYAGYPDSLLAFMRQQRCGYNPFLDMVCHQRDGRLMYGPLPDSTYVDASGGWHDAGDQLKYLITGSYATGHMLMAFDRYPDQFLDQVNALGQPGSNGIPDILDEAKWGLDWILKLHPRPDMLIHQIADDRDHRGYKMPDEDISDYGWGPNSYRVAYVATGKPQGLNKYQSEATGYANLAGRSAAALALGSRIWLEQGLDSLFAGECLRAAKSLYALGKANEGYQQGNSYGAPYRYGEITWADDMEWAAAELYWALREPDYLEEAKHYARIAADEGWNLRDTTEHYRYYPFINLGHYALHSLVEAPFQDSLEQWYRAGIAYPFSKGMKNPYQIGIPFIWCSNNLLTSLLTQIILYEDMSGDTTYHSFLLQQRDWLFGYNPWGHLHVHRAASRRRISLGCAHQRLGQNPARSRRGTGRWASLQQHFWFAERSPTQ